jgi:RNA:NAD 2'-phosphotransferase (TPT1/KptA family)
MSSEEDKVKEELLTAAQNGDLLSIQSAFEKESQSTFEDHSRRKREGSKNYYLTHEVKDWAGDTLLSVACWYGHANIVEYLFSCGSDINTKNNQLHTPLHRAAQRSDIALVNLLVEKGADIIARDKSGRLPQDLCGLEIRTLLRTLYAMQLFDQESKVIESAREKKTALMNTILERQKRAVNIVIRGATQHEFINGVFDPIGKHYGEWPVYCQRAPNGTTSMNDLYLVYLDSSMEWVVQESHMLGTPVALLRAPQNPPNFPELRVEPNDTIIETIPTRRSYGSGAMGSIFLSSSDHQKQPSSHTYASIGIEILTEAEILADEMMQQIKQGHFEMHKVVSFEDIEKEEAENNRRAQYVDSSSDEEEGRELLSTADGGDGTTISVFNGIKTEKLEKKEEEKEVAVLDQSEKQIKRKRDNCSRWLASQLRHNGTKSGLKFRKDGYTPVADLTKVCKKYHNLDIDFLQEICRECKKQRFSMIQGDGGEWLIRANQGHSGAVAKQIDPEQIFTEIFDAAEIPICVHGTFLDVIDTIKEKGLNKMKRHMIHCAIGVPEDDAVISGMRITSEVSIFVDTAKALSDGMRFFRSLNNVIMTEGFDGVVPPKYFKEIEIRLRSSCGK